MRRALMGLNLYGREAVRHKLKNGLKTQKKHFLAVLHLMSDSLTARLARMCRNFDDYPGFQPKIPFAI